MEIPFNLLILPFLGGYVFVRFFNYFRIHTLRDDKERLIIRSSLAGFASLCIAWLVHSVAANILPCDSFSFCVPTIWRSLVPFEHSGIAVGAFLIGASAWYPLNELIPAYDRKEQINRAIKEDADPLELILKRSQDEGIALAITLVNEKVYIGRVVHTFNPATPTNNVGLLPLQSGFRDPTTKRMELALDYASTMQSITNDLDEISMTISEMETEYQHAVKDGSPVKNVKMVEDKLADLKCKFEDLERSIGLFSLVIPVSQISSVHVFDTEIYSKYFASP